MIPSIVGLVMESCPHVYVHRLLFIPFRVSQKEEF